MKRRETSRIQFDALQIEGALIQPDVVAKIAAGQAWGQTDESYGVLPGLKLRDEVGRYYQVGRTLWQRFETGRGGENADSVHMQFARDFLTKVLGFEFDDAAVRSTTSAYQETACPDCTRRVAGPRQGRNDSRRRRQLNQAIGHDCSSGRVERNRGGSVGDSVRRNPP
jgi:hypothetical protein